MRKDLFGSRTSVRQQDESSLRAARRLHGYNRQPRPFGYVTAAGSFFKSPKEASEANEGAVFPVWDQVFPVMTDVPSEESLGLTEKLRNVNLALGKLTRERDDLCQSKSELAVRHMRLQGRLQKLQTEISHLSDVDRKFLTAYLQGSAEDEEFRGNVQGASVLRNALNLVAAVFLMPSERGGAPRQAMAQG